MSARYRQLPDGTWLDTTTATVSAPLSGDLATISPQRKMVATGAIIGVAALTVWLQRRKKAKKATKKLAKG